MQDRLEALRAIETHWSAKDPAYPGLPPERGLFKQMTLDLGLTRVAATLEWCDRCLERLE